MAKKYISSSVGETHKLAIEILKDPKTNLICLYGDLGSGKTTFTQGLAKALGIKDRVISPTFVLLRQYKIKSHKLQAISCQQLIHVDCYRLRSEKDFKAIDLEELWSDPKNLVIIEWAEKVKNILPKKRLDIYFEYLDKNKRELRIVNC